MHSQDNSRRHFLRRTLAAGGALVFGVASAGCGVADSIEALLVLRGGANRAYHDMLGQIVRILCCDLIHGDLSPYNVLWAESGPTIIDFPQSVSAPANSRADAGSPRFRYQTCASGPPLLSCDVIGPWKAMPLL